MVFSLGGGQFVFSPPEPKRKRLLTWNCGLRGTVNHKSGNDVFTTWMNCIVSWEGFYQIDQSSNPIFSIATAAFLKEQKKKKQSKKKQTNKQTKTQKRLKKCRYLCLLKAPITNLHLGTVTRLSSCVHWAFTIDESSPGLADRLSYLLGRKSCIFYQCVLLVVASRIFSCSV